jgi:hypothetical protein
MKRFFGVLFSLGLSCSACDRGGSKEGNPSEAPSASAAAASEVAVLNPITEEDFEEEAERQINGDNLDSELDALEKEIGSD